jgi:hypothetical protein
MRLSRGWGIADGAGVFEGFVGRLVFMVRSDGFHLRSPRRGAVLIQCLVLLTVLVGLTSLGADYGRVQLAKMELERCAVAAARAAGAKMLSDQSAARDLAVTYGGYNKVDGSALVIQRDNDVEFGHWDPAGGTFTPLTGSAAASADAVRVTARRTTARGNAVPLTFGALVGRASVDVSASSVVTATSTAVIGFVGLDSMTFGANLYAASYNSNAGAPGGANVGSSAMLGSNGLISLGNNADVMGGIVKGPAATVQSGTNLFVTGGQTTQPAPIAYPPTEPAPVPSSGAFNGTTLTLSAGTYHYSSMTFGIGGTITTSGPVTIYVSGNITATNRLTFDPYLDKPSNLRIRMIGSGSINVQNDASGAAEIYAPGGSVTFQNNLTFGGAIVARSLYVKNNADIFRDTAADAGGGTVVMTTVK